MIDPVSAIVQFHGDPSIAKPLRLLCGAVVVARSLWGSHGVPAVWLDTDGMCPFALYCAGIIRRAFFVKEQQALSACENIPFAICFCRTTNSP